ncbi:hypothetical protein ACMFWY_16010 [Roseiconus sp. JC912]|uniref:hypothetical protein n=1 Tax=Roseiconus sp. JC912 TaxID=3396307 RepID=UPI003A4C6455
MSKVIVVAGMHRSGTSLVCQQLAELGVRFNGDLLPPSKHNKRGYYENKKLICFHDRLIKTHAKSWRDYRSLRSLNAGEVFDYEGAVSIARELRGGGGVVALKDPRICFFLKQWVDVLGDCVVVAPVRDPSEVVDSLMRRGDLLREYRGKRLAAIHAGYSLWKMYNEACLAYLQAVPGSGFLVNSGAGFSVAALSSGLKDFGLVLPGSGNDSESSSVLDESLVSTQPHRLVRFVRYLRPDVLRLYSAILGICDRAAGGS